MPDLKQWINEHGSAIIQNPTPVKIGHIFHTAYDKYEAVKYPLVVVREATLEEYLAQGTFIYGEDRNTYFYEVTTD